MMNPHDDYEKLAKLLYPSIEASGNVYYGQTRKLMLDEIFKKNDIGFECYIKSYREDDINSAHGFKYTSEFSWKLGPLYGSIPFNPNMVDVPGDSLRYTFDNFPDVSEVELINFYEDEENCTIYPQSEDDGTDTDVKHLYREYLDGIIFAKYLIEIDNTTINNRISSGSYNTYETSATAVFQNICCTDFFDPTNPSNRNVGDRQFYIKEDTDGKVYLYIQMCSDGIELEVPAESYVPKPLTIKAAKGDFTIRLEAQYDTSVLDPEYDLNGCYSYSLNNGEWHEINSFHREEVWGYYWTVSDYISISENDTISFKGSWREIDSHSHYVSIGMYSNDDYPEVEASGRITSMYSGYDTASGTDVPSIFAGLFEGCTYLTKAPKIPVTKYVQPYMFYKTFAYCISLREMPLLLSNETNSHCYESMFADCTALRETSVMSFLPSSSFCDNMFSGCTQLNKVICYSYDPYEMFDYSEWLTNAASVGEFFTIDENGWTTGAGGIPSGWSVYEDPSYRREMRYSVLLMSGNDVGNEVMSVGTDSANNGRGIISDESTLYSMEESFDENGTHTMGTFNDDGSYNQDIWGYKSFNSPVQFRNGIYGECASLTTVPLSDHPYGASDSYKGSTLFTYDGDYKSYIKVECDSHSSDEPYSLSSIESQSNEHTARVATKATEDYGKVIIEGDSLWVDPAAHFENDIDIYGTVSCEKLVSDEIDGCIPFPNVDEDDTTIIHFPVGSIALVCLDSDYYQNYSENIDKPLTLTVVKADDSSIGSIDIYPKHFDGSLYYSRDGGDTYTQWYDSVSIEVNLGESIQIKGSSSFKSRVTSLQDEPVFNMVGSSVIYASGNINSLIMGSNTLSSITSVPANSFNCLFNRCNRLVTTPYMPATTVNSSAYYGMFANCTNLRVPPKLPATYVSDYMYANMFSGCTSLEISPLIGLTNLDNYVSGNNDSGILSFADMFNGCSKLKLLYSDIQTGTPTTNMFQNWVNNISQVGSYFKDSNSPIPKPSVAWREFTYADARTRYTSGPISVIPGQTFGMFDIIQMGAANFQVQNILPAYYDAPTQSFESSENCRFDLPVNAKFQILSGWSNNSTQIQYRKAYVLVMRVN